MVQEPLVSKYVFYCNSKMPKPKISRQTLLKKLLAFLTDPKGKGRSCHETYGGALGLVKEANSMSRKCGQELFAVSMAKEWARQVNRFRIGTLNNLGGL